VDEKDKGEIVHENIEKTIVTEEHKQPVVHEHTEKPVVATSVITEKELKRQVPEGTVLEGEEEFEEYVDEHGKKHKRSLGRRILDKLTGKSHHHDAEPKHL
jgi:hypothetical protein